MSTAGLQPPGLGDELYDPVRVGIAAAEHRLARHGLRSVFLEQDSSSIERVLNSIGLAQVALNEQVPEAPPHAVELFIELVALGASARVFYKEDDFNPDSMNEFLRSVAKGVNSIFHDPP